MSKSDENALAIRPDNQIELSTGGVQLRSVTELMEWCTIAANSRLAPKDLQTPESIFIAVQMGMEIGLTPTQALQSIAVIHGRPAVWGDAALAVVKGHRECVDIIESFEGGDDGMTAICEVLRRDKAPVKRKFSVAMAKKAGLWGKSGPWSQYSARMLQMRARSWALRDSFPDALKGIGIREEIQDYQSGQRMPKAVSGIVLPDEAPEADQPTTSDEGQAEL